MSRICLRDRSDPLPTVENVLDDKGLNIVPNVWQTVTPIGSGRLYVFDHTTLSNVSLVNRFISASGYWHCAANWSLGHVPWPNEDVLISGVGQVYCMVHGDVHARDITVSGRTYLETGDHASILGRSLILEANSYLNMGNSMWTLTGDWTARARIVQGTSTITFIANDSNISPRRNNDNTS